MSIAEQVARRLTREMYSTPTLPSSVSMDEWDALRSMVGECQALRGEPVYCADLPEEANFLFKGIPVVIGG